jgi:hypothetical protein
MHEMYTVKNSTAFVYFLKLASSCKKWVKRLKQNPKDEETLKKAKIEIECMEALGSVAFGAKEFKELRKDNPDVPYLSKSR